MGRSHLICMIARKIVPLHLLILLYMKRLFLVFAVTLCVLTACNSNRDRLIEINGYLNDNRLDTAQICLNMVSPNDLSEYDRALYNLITVKLDHLSYNPVPSDAIIRTCIDVFTRSDDKERLAESLYYQAVTNYEEGHVPQAFTAMKKAEAVAQDIDDLNIRHKIFESLTDWNMTEHQYQLAMTYGKRNLTLATLANNNNWIAYALVFISQIYSGMGKRDSASHYLDKCVAYIEDVPDSQRVDFYNYIAALTLKTDLSAAHTYAMMGNDIRPNSLSYITLAKIRCREGVDNAIIDSLCDKANELASNPGERKYVLQQTMRLYEEQKRFDKATFASMAYCGVLDAEAKMREEHDVRNVQAAYDYDMKELSIKRNTKYYIIAAIIMVLATVLLILYDRHCVNKQIKANKQRKLLIKEYQQSIEELEKQNKDLDNKITYLTNRIAHFHEEQPKILQDGRKLYDHIMDGGATEKWEDEDYFCFIEYYRIIDFNFVTHLEEDYNNLSNRNMMFMILFHMNKNDEEVAKIMRVSEDSIRMTKKRLRQKRE